jgi:DNA replication protein DnaC
VLDDLAIAPITAPERQDLLELLDDRVGSRSTLITSQLPTSPVAPVTKTRRSRQKA